MIPRQFADAVTGDWTHRTVARWSGRFMSSFESDSRADLFLTFLLSHQAAMSDDGNKLLDTDTDASAVRIPLQNTSLL